MEILWSPAVFANLVMKIIFLIFEAYSDVLCNIYNIIQYLMLLSSEACEKPIDYLNAASETNSK